MTLQSGREEVTIATQVTLESCNSREDRGHSGAGDGMGCGGERGGAFFLGGSWTSDTRPCSEDSVAETRLGASISPISLVLNQFASLL